MSIKIPKYNLAEELINSISHGIAALGAITAMILCIIKSSSASSVVAVTLYGSFMIMLFTISCIYHALSPRCRGKKVLRVIDHCNVILMVYGTYLPICLSLLKGTLGWTIFGIVTTITIVGIVFNSINVDEFSLVTTICVLILGWGSLFMVGPLINAATFRGVMYLIFGGIAYTIGAVLYGLGKNIPYMHSIFHFCVILGAIYHFIFIYYYCI